jgi:hypothetical protein
MRLGHLVLHQVLAHLNSQLGIRQIVEVRLGCLQAVNEGMTGSLVAVPRVVRPVSSRFGFVGTDVTHVGVDQGKCVRHPIHAVLADDTQEAHPST